MSITITFDISNREMFFFQLKAILMFGSVINYFMQMRIRCNFERKPLDGIGGLPAACRINII